MDAAIAFQNERQLSASDLRRLNRIISFFTKGTTCDEVDEEMLRNAANRMLGPYAKKATRARDAFGPMKSFLRWCKKQDWCDQPDFESFPVSDPLESVLTPPEAEQLVDVSAPFDAYLWIFSACYGHHVSELAALARRDVDLHYDRFGVRVKSDRDKFIIRRNRIFPRVRPIFEKLLALPGKPSDPLFRRADLTPLHAPSGEGAGQYVRTRLQRSLALAGLDELPLKFTHRSFRTTMATWLMSATNGNIDAVMRFGGWKTLDMVIRYRQFMDPALKPDILKFFGLPPDTNLVEWLDRTT